MPKKNLATTLTPEVTQALVQLGKRLRACRIDRQLTIAQMSEKMLCSINTYRDLEAGKPSASLGNFAKDGGEFSGAARDYFASPAFRETPPQLLIWEIPERDLQSPYKDDIELPAL